jgi:hypothetical protein
VKQDGFASEMREIEKSIYIAADVELTRCDIDDSKEYGKAWGGASAGDIVGAPRVCLPSAVPRVPASHIRQGMPQCTNGPLMPIRAPLQGPAQQGKPASHASHEVLVSFFIHTFKTYRAIASAKSASTSLRAFASRLENLSPLAPVRRHSNASVPILRKSRLPRIGYLRLPAHQGPHR